MDRGGRMSQKFKCSKCWEVDDMGKITRFLCSLYGLREGMAPCQCAHHRHDQSLHERVVAEKARRAALRRAA